MFVQLGGWQRYKHGKIFQGVQGLRHHPVTYKGLDLIPGQTTKIPHTMWCGQKKKKILIRWRAESGVEKGQRNREKTDALTMKSIRDVSFTISAIKQHLLLLLFSR